MTTAYLMIEDGPARGASMMMVHRLPRYLRVVESIDHKFDVLNELDDEPEMGETIHIYKLAPGRQGHIKGRTRAQSGPMVLYLHEPNMSTEGMEDRDAWRAAVEKAVEQEEQRDGENSD